MGILAFLESNMAASFKIKQTYSRLSSHPMPAKIRAPKHRGTPLQEQEMLQFLAGYGKQDITWSFKNEL